ncbi:MAG TPA: ABC transporter permease [Candidatus Thermoplasmatota archaeon]|nr:ABC transporter permease [Candidatus Thermoplasmatota archaeon]
MTMMEVFSEIFAIFNRWNKKLVRQPILIFFTLIQPLVWFLLFTQAFSAIGNIPTFKILTGTSSYITFFTAAVIIQTIASSALNAGIGLVTDFDSGFMDKMRVAPINKSSILFGRLFSAAITTVIQVIIILAIGYALGVTVASGVLGILVLLVLAALFGIAWSGISLFVALTTKNQETTLSVGLLTTFPLLFLSASVMPLGLLPDWVQQVAKVNPFTYIAEAFQSLIIKGFVWEKIEYAFIAIIIVGAISLGASILVFRKKIS